jgi:hypothetical protein
MNKKILTAAIGAALVAGSMAASADMKISGRVAASFLSKGGTGAGSGLQFADYGNSRIQFDVNDDSGWFARAAMDTRNWFGGGSSVGRDFFAGYKASFGSISAGRMAGAGKNIEGDPFIATFLEYRNNFVNGGAYGSSGFINNMVQLSTKSGDVAFKVQYAPCANTATTCSNNGDLGASVKAKLAGADVYAAYNNQGNASGEAYYKVGGSMKFGDIKGKLIYESDSGAVVGSHIAGDSAYTVGAEFGMGDGAMVDASYVNKGKDGTNAGYRLAYMKKASKKARWWVGYVNNGAGINNLASYGGGARVDF